MRRGTCGSWRYKGRNTRMFHGRHYTLSALDPNKTIFLECRGIMFSSSQNRLVNALLPIITATGIRLGQVFSGAVVVEAVFGWPGLGQLAFQSVLRRDYPIVLGILIFATMIVIIANILTDFAYRIVDPRIRTT